MPIDRDLVKLRINDVYESISEPNRLTSKRFNEMSIDEKYSMRYNVIVLVEALASLCLHIALEHYGLRPESYAECFRGVLERLGVRCCRDLEALARLRNLLVHRYWAVKDEIVYNSVKKNFRCVEEFIERVRELVLR
jgi:uncharacterized protein YutE (UPF0331/DUF86 family)